MSFYGTSSDIVRKKFTPGLSSIPIPKEHVKNKEYSLATDKRELIDISQQVNKTQVVDSTENSGFYCSACNITLKDSSSYLDHVNSRAHSRNIGQTMRVEKATLEQVKERIEFHKMKLLEPKKSNS